MVQRKQLEAMERKGVIRRHPFFFGLLGLAVAVAISVPLVAYVVIPALTRSTLVEALPSPNPSGVSSAPASQILRQGDLKQLNAADFGHGKVQIVQAGDTRYLRFDNVEIAAAPDMFVYLSDRTDGQPGNFTDLGRLKATNGSFNYALPSGLDLSRFGSLVVWCRTFHVTVTYAVLS
jgi:Electron transfer DM13